MHCLTLWRTYSSPPIRTATSATITTMATIRARLRLGRALAVRAVVVEAIRRILPEFPVSLLRTPPQKSCGIRHSGSNVTCNTFWPYAVRMDETRESDLRERALRERAGVQDGYFTAG